MAGEDRSVFEFLHQQYEEPNLPKICTIRRTQESKYQFYLLIRHYRQTLKQKPKFFLYTRAEAPAVKAQLEEHTNPLLGGTDLVVMEGFPSTFINSLRLPDDTHVVAETDGMTTTTLTPYSESAQRRRRLLSILNRQLSLRFNPTGLKAATWSALNRDEEYEAVLRRCRVMGWNANELQANLEQMEIRTQLWVEAKASHWKTVFAEIDKRGPELIHYRLTQLLGQVIHLRVLRNMGYEEQRLAREIGVSSYRLEELKETADTLSQEDVTSMATRLVELDPLLMRNRDLGLSLFLLNAPIRLTR